MLEVWNNLSDGQGAVLAALLTIVAALVGVIFGSILFGGKVRSLETALQKTEDNVIKFRESVENQMADVEPQIGAVLAIVRDLQNATEELSSEQEAPATAEHAAPTRENLKAVWHQIRDKIEETASSPLIGGRTRAKYGRIPRYSYEELIRSISRDGYLGTYEAALLEANSIWQNYQRRPENPPQNVFDRLQELRDQIAPAILPSTPVEMEHSAVTNTSNG